MLLKKKTYKKQENRPTRQEKKDGKIWHEYIILRTKCGRSSGLDRFSGTPATRKAEKKSRCVRNVTQPKPYNVLNQDTSQPFPEGQLPTVGAAHSGWRWCKHEASMCGGTTGKHDSLDTPNETFTPHISFYNDCHMAPVSAARPPTQQMVYLVYVRGRCSVDLNET